MDYPLRKERWLINSKNIIINNGSGQANITNGTYQASAQATGYDSSKLTPQSVEITSEINTYSFTIEANGTLTLHVTENGQASGTPVVGATFVRCDKNGTAYGTPITSNSEGNAVFEKVPYAASDSLKVYYKQTASDTSHTFDDTLQTLTLTSETTIQEVTNALAPQKTFTLLDANYSNLPIENGTITLE